MPHDGVRLGHEVCPVFGPHAHFPDRETTKSLSTNLLYPRRCDMLTRFRLTYVGDPAVLHLPDGPDRARLAYAIYLSEARTGEELISFEEARRHFRTWSGEKPVRDRGKRKNGQRTPAIRDVLKVQNPH